MRTRTKALLGAVVVGVLVLGGVVGGVVNHALAQPGSGAEDASTPQEQFLSSVAANLGVSVDQLKGAIQSTELDMLDNAVQQGKVRPEVADRLRQRIEEGQLALPLRRAAALQGRLGPGQRLVLRAAADVLNVTPQELASEMRTTGKSLAQVAEEKGVSRDDLKSGITADVQKHLDKGLERLGANIDRIIDWAPGQPAASPTQ
jgi:lambda repressor-like predicted transcriptional regulator